MHKSAISFVAAILLATPVYAGSLSWTVTTSGGTTTFAADVSDADIARIVAAYRAAQAVPAETSTDEVKRLIIRDALNRLLAQAMATEAQRAADDARAAISPIVATPQ